MWFDASFYKNPFESTDYSRARKLLFAYDQVARLTALDGPAFAARTVATQQAADALSTAGSTTGAATGTRRGATLGTDAQLQAYRKVVGGKYNVLLDRFGGNKQAPLLVTLFGPSVQPYTAELTKTNAKQRLNALNMLLADNAAAVGADIVQAITEAANRYLGVRQQQTAEKGKTSVAQLGEAAQETALNEALWLNLVAVVAHYPAPEQAPQRHAAADFSLLERPAARTEPYTEAGTLAPGQVHTLLADGLRPGTRLRLHNLGTHPLQLSLSAVPARLGTTVRVVPPAETLDLPAADLGDVAALPFLTLAAPADDKGRYELTVGG